MDDAAPGIPRTALPYEVLRAVLEALDRGQRAVMASVIARHGSAPSTPGQKLALFDDGTAVGTIGGGAVERVVLAAMVDALSGPPPAPRMETFRLGASLGMCCGGSVDILIEPLVPPVGVLIVGAGHVGVFAAPLLASLGFRVTLCDARDAAMDPERLALVPSPTPGGEGAATRGEPASFRAATAVELAAMSGIRLVHAEHDDPEVVQTFARPAEAAALVMTHDHMLDQAVIEWALGRGFGFVGGVGSRAKAARTRARLEAKGFRAEDIARVRMPVGIDIAARTPGEISVAIASELIAWRSARQQVVRRVISTSSLSPVSPVVPGREIQRAAGEEAERDEVEHDEAERNEVEHNDHELANGGENRVPSPLAIHAPAAHSSAVPRQ